jgi:hypothetical protein
MTIVDLYGVAPFLIAGLILWFAIVGFRAVKKVRGVGKVAVIAISLPAAIGSALALAILTLGIGCNTRFAPAYSPDRASAARITNIDGGALGGNSSVILFRSFGLKQQFIYKDRWMGLGPDSVHWLSNSVVEIDTYDPTGVCENVAGISVHCVYKGTER